MKTRIKSMICNVRKQKKPINQNNKKKKRIHKNKDRISSFLDDFKLQHSHHWDARRRREEQEIGNLFEKNNERKLP